MQQQSDDADSVAAVVSEPLVIVKPCQINWQTLRAVE